MRSVRVLSLFFGLFLIGLTLWTHRYFGRVTVDQALSTISFGIHGVLTSDSLFIKRFIEWCLFWPLVLLVVITILSMVASKLEWQSRIASKYPFVILLLGIVMVVNQYHLGEFTRSLFGSKTDLFKSIYVDPAKIAFRVKQPKNLVLIYVESLETTYSDKALFDRDLLESLNNATASDIHFKRYQQMPGTGWTIAGIVSTQCGIPLRLLTIFDPNRMGENVNHYLPGAKCLSDILAEHGYKNVFMNGPSLEFSGVNVFLQDHHYHEAYGKEEWLKQGVLESDMQAWGLTDDQLFEKAKVKLAQLMREKQPFNLTILTIDTHGLSGQLNKTCRAKGYRRFSGIVKCTADEVADFVNYIKQQGWLNNVNIVVQGDHLAMENDVSDILRSVRHRNVYSAIVSSEQLMKNTDSIVHYDMFPTMLDLLGFEYPGGKLGLGYSAIRKIDLINPKMRKSIFEKLATQSSATYNQFWLAKPEDTV